MSVEKIRAYHKVVFRKNLGKRMRLARLLEELPQKELAKDLDVTPNYLAEVERGRREPSLALVHAIAIRFGIDIDFFFRGGLGLNTFNRLERGKEDC